MPYTTEDGGRLNNFANEPKMYQAEPPTTAEKRNYLILGALALALVAGLCVVAFSVSQAG
ncbi:MAG TPA: ssl1498 family light-harvesting-like protein [Leptolyngbyaceae cyanobacterium M65_K2018_010]|nr:ssl1498 family light-harvesting-like protein [Leptolyngbyaceae cyanobacterium M65_K2018_010]